MSAQIKEIRSTKPLVRIGSMQSFDLAREVADQLASVLNDVVLCPGSRTSPLALALLGRADIRVHTRIDERSAAFLALGMARVQRRPVGVVMTSGTAVANTLPAMIEAAHSHVPFAVISADRPRRLVGTGASQTIEQQGLFATVTPTHQIESLEDVTEISELFTKEQQLHLNVAFDTPLVPEAPSVSDTPLVPGTPLVAEVPLVSDTPSTPASSAVSLRRTRPAVSQHWVDHGEVPLDLSLNTLVIAGDEAWEVPGLEDVPTIAEPTAPAPYHPVHPGAAAVFSHSEISHGEYSARMKPDQIVVVGHPTLHRPVLNIMADPDIHLTVLSRTPQFTDPTGNAAQRGTRVAVSGQPTQQWLNTCDAAGTLAADAVRDILASQDYGFTGLHVAAAVADTLGDGDVIFIGASNPIRDLAWAGMPFPGVRAYSPRGTAGIDGSVSQAIGVALATQTEDPTAPSAPRTVALLGDVTFLHDAPGLFIGPNQPRPENLTIVVANDNGGGIFETLEMGAPHWRESFERGFGTPHDDVSLAHLCAAYSVDYRSVSSTQELLDLLVELTPTNHGVTVIEAHTSREHLRKLHADFATKVTL